MPRRKREPAGSSEKPKIIIDDRCKETPRRIYLADERAWVGIGGSIEMAGDANTEPYVVPEATEKQYLKIGKTSPLVTILSKD